MMKEIPSMVNRSSYHSSKKLVSIVVFIERPLSLSDPILMLLKSSYPKSRIEVFFAGKDTHKPKKEVYQQFLGQFKSVKTVKIKSAESLYSEVFALTKGEICLFTTNDCSPDTQWVKRMVQVFIEDDLTGMVLGGIQQRCVDFHNKVEQYCEQIGWGSTGEIPEKESGYLTSTKVEILEDKAINRIIPLLKPVNMAINRSLLLRLSKDFTVLDILGKLRNEKYKFFYNPEAEIERFHSMDFKELNREMQSGIGKKAAWLARNSKRVNIQIQLFDKPEWSLPFWVSVNVSWGDFHWLNLFGVLVLMECLTKGFLAHFGEGFWFNDEVLLLISAFGFFSFRYFLPVLKIQPWSNFILWCWIRYRTNMSMFLRGLWTGLKFKCFYWGESW
jgi:hypothetical protein